MLVYTTYNRASWLQDTGFVVHANFSIHDSFLLEACIEHVHTEHFTPLKIITIHIFRQGQIQRKVDGCAQPESNLCPYFRDDQFSFFDSEGCPLPGLTLWHHFATLQDIRHTRFDLACLNKIDIVDVNTGVLETPKWRRWNQTIHGHTQRIYWMIRKTGKERKEIASLRGSHSTVHRILLPSGQKMLTCWYLIKE